MTRRRGPLVVVGDALLDVDLDGRSERLTPDAPAPVVDQVQERPRPGGAALAALLAARDGYDVVLVAPLADDDAAARLRSLLDPVLDLVAVPWSGGTPVKQRVRVDGRSLVRIDTGDAPGEVGPPPAAAGAALRSAAAVLVSDYGRGASASEPLRAALHHAGGRAPLVWDPHRRGAPPVPGARLVTPNAAEAQALAGPDGPAAGGSDIGAVGRCAATLVRRWQAATVAVTLGSRGALLSHGDGPPLVVPAPAVPCADPCGAGDRFAAAATALLAGGALPSEAVAGAVEAASEFVAAGGAAAVPAAVPAADPAPAGRSRRTADDVVAQARARGGTVVATGGCFDLLHAGHVATLRAARALGDCLVVCLNSDDSVRRLKGPGRPLVPEQDRAGVLEALECVDAVAVFAEDTPDRILDRLRPDIWAKGGDYAGVSLPEADLVAGWGGQAVLLPYLDGRSTTGLVRRALAHQPKETL